MNPRIPRPLKIALLTVVGIALFSCARRFTREGPLGGPLGGAGGGAAAVAAPPPPREAAGPRMNHEKHMGKGLECVDCHLQGWEEGTPIEPRTITYAACSDCHDDEDKALPEEKRVKNVFFKPDGSPAWETSLEPYDGDVLWSHAAHNPRLQCTDCHRDLDVLPRMVRELFSMDACMACHAERGAPNQCATCHKVLREDVKPPSHDPAFLTSHGAAWKADARECQICHKDPGFCDRCHQTQRPPSHDASWRFGHGAPAQAQQEKCQFCHTDPAACDRCHQATKPSSHGPGWLSAHGHASIARTERCEMCHTNPDGCVKCHLVTKPASHDHLWMERHGDVAINLRGRAEGRCELCHLDPNFCQSCHAVEEPRNHTHLFRTRTHGIQAAIDRASCQVCHESDFCIRCHEDTPPRSHGPMWASGPNLHCAQCHFPIRFEGSCRTCHFEEPTHSSAPDQPAWHTPGMNCRFCHTPAGNGAPPLRHIDNGTQCEVCHK